MSVPLTAVVPIVSGPMQGKLTAIRLTPSHPIDSSRFIIESARILSTPADSFVPFSRGQVFELGRLPHIWGTFDDKKAVETTRVLDTLNTQEISASSNTMTRFELAPDIDKNSGNYLHLKVRSDQWGICAVSYGKRWPSSFEFQLIPSAEYQDYLVRISSQWAWNEESVNELSVKTTVPIHIKEVYIRKGD